MLKKKINSIMSNGMVGVHPEFGAGDAVGIAYGLRASMIRVVDARRCPPCTYIN